jgi:phytoene desaturase
MTELSGEDVLVVGGGFGGLSAACHLADAGADVRVVEKNDQLGGRASRLERDGFRFDMGPSWYLMPDVFERFFGHFGREPSEFYELERLDPHYRIFFKNGARADGGAAGSAGVAAGTGATDLDPAATPSTTPEAPDAAADVIDVNGDLDAMYDLFEAHESGAGGAYLEYQDII